MHLTKKAGSWILIIKKSPPPPKYLSTIVLCFSFLFISISPQRELGVKLSCTCQGPFPSLTDTDECANGMGSVRCRGNRVCVNTPGAYRCDCAEGYREVDGICKGVVCAPHYLASITVISTNSFHSNGRRNLHYYCSFSKTIAMKSL